MGDTGIFIFLAIFYTIFFGLLGTIPYTDVSAEITELNNSDISQFLEDYSGYSTDNSSVVYSERYNEIKAYLEDRNCSLDYLTEEPCSSYIEEGGFFKSYTCKTAIRVAYAEGSCGANTLNVIYPDENNEYNPFYTFLGNISNNISGLPPIVNLIIFSPLLIIGGYWLVLFVLKFIPFVG